MLRAVCLISFLTISQFSLALTPFEKHFLSVTQGMSAFYMYLLSSEDKKFQREYNRLFDQATKDLNASKDDIKTAFLPRWEQLRPALDYERSDEMGATLNENIRVDFRKYVVDLYLEFSKNNTKAKYTQDAFDRIQVYSYLLTARALDIDSTIYGIGLFTEHDFLLDQISVYDLITADLAALQNSSLPNENLKQLRRIEAKLKFIKDSLVNYETQSATYLLYQNTLSIDKIIEAQKADIKNIATSLL